MAALMGFWSSASDHSAAATEWLLCSGSGRPTRAHKLQQLAPIIPVIIYLSSSLEMECIRHFLKASAFTNRVVAGIKHSKFLFFEGSLVARTGQETKQSLE